MASGPIISWQTDGETMETVTDFIFLVRESFPRQVDKKSRGPQGERGLEFSRRKKGQTFFFSTFLRIIQQQCILPEDSLWIKPSG